jgi:hypothetical protein
MTEFDDVIQLLQDGRPRATDLELDKIKQRARRQAADNSRRKQSMKSRLAIVAMVAFGMVFSTAGAGLAVSGIASDTQNASVAQYGTPTPTPTPTPTATPCNNSSGSSNSASETPACTPTPTPTATNDTPEGGVLPAEENNNAPSGGTAPASGSAPASGTQTTTQPTRQVEAATGSQLPFTGFAAIPVMLGGIALLTGGLVLRRRTRSE